MWWLTRNNYTAEAKRLIARHGVGVYDICLNEAWIKSVDGVGAAALHQRRLARRIAELIKSDGPATSNENQQSSADGPRNNLAL